MKSAVVLAVMVTLSACGSGADQPQKPREAPKRAPMALDPNPPMSSSDIDAIVNQSTSHRVQQTTPDNAAASNSGG